LNPQKNQGNGGGQAYAAKAGLSKELWSRRGAKKNEEPSPGAGVGWAPAMGKLKELGMGPIFWVFF